MGDYQTIALANFNYLKIMDNSSKRLEVETLVKYFDLNQFPILLPVIMILRMFLPLTSWECFCAIIYRDVDPHITTGIV